MSKKLILLLSIVLIALFAATLSACTVNQEADDEGYVEVTAVRVPEAKVYLSPSGAPSTYQLAPIIVPDNATNRKLEYFISPEDVGYFTVDGNGFITASKVTEDKPEGVHVKIFSTTNNEAYTYVTVFVEYVAVESISFAQSEMSVLYNSAPQQLELKYTPYHAIDGRDVIYESQHEEVATVDSMGLMTVHSVGITTIIARSNTLAGAQIEGRTRITVSYAKGRYRLEVTNSDPRYEQVIGNPSVISFNIIKLDPQSDPNPKITWYVGQQRDPTQDNKWFFEYYPSSDTATNFTVYAEITPKGELPIKLASEKIYLYEAFSGFKLALDEPTENRYVFGETVELPSNITQGETLDWYIKSNGEKGYGEKIATTEYSDNAGKLSYVVDREGSRIVTVVSRNGDTKMSESMQNMEIVKYTIGDKVIVSPVTDTNEKPPESYDWYVHTYDSSLPEGLRLGTGVFVKTTVANATFTYKADVAGEFVISAIPTVDGVPVTIEVPGETVTKISLVGYTTPIKIWSGGGNSNIFDVEIEAVERGGEYLPSITWNSIGGVDNYIVEVEYGDVGRVIRSADKEENEKAGIVFGINSVTLPSSVAKLDKDITVRVKCNGGFYSNAVTYAANTVTDVIKPYLKEYTTGMNGYIRNVAELGKLLNFFAAYRPSEYVRKVEGDTVTYGFSIYCEVQYASLDSAIFPVTKESTSSDEAIKNIYKLINASYNAYCGGFEVLNLGLNKNGEHRYEILLTLKAQPEELLSQKGYGYTTVTELNTVKENDARPSAFADFNISLKTGENVTTVVEMFMSAESGKNPQPVAGSEAETFYNEAKKVLVSIIGNTMSQKEKVLAIYDYLAGSIEFDKDVYDFSRLSPRPTDPYLYYYSAYQLEGVFFDKKAVADGIAKAFSFMCWMEGITCFRVNGMVDGAKHTWNKVYIENEWYNVDATKARTQIESESGNTAMVSHGYLLVSDATLIAAGFVQYGGFAASVNDYELSGWVLGE